MEKESLGEEILAELEVWKRSTEKLEGLLERWRLEVQRNVKDGMKRGGKEDMERHVAAARLEKKSERKEGRRWEEDDGDFLERKREEEGPLTRSGAFDTEWWCGVRRGEGGGIKERDDGSKGRGGRSERMKERRPDERERTWRNNERKEKENVEEVVMALDIKGVGVGGYGEALRRAGHRKLVERLVKPEAGREKTASGSLKQEEQELVERKEEGGKECRLVKVEAKDGGGKVKGKMDGMDERRFGSSKMVGRVKVGGKV